jgi:hypothetical protein
MKLSRLSLILALAAAWPLHAQQDEDQKNKTPPVEIPDFSNLDEYVYVPKNNLNFGLRYISGIKAKFSGNGYIGAPEALVDATAANISRTYHDGDVEPDQRVETVNNGDSTASSVSVPSDGKTNTWSYLSPTQVTPDDYMQFNTYGAQTLNNGSHSASGKGTMGMELSSARDMGNLSKHFAWRLFCGFSINDIQAATSVYVPAQLTTVTDTYDLYGQTPPSAPGSAASGTTAPLLNANGTQITDSSGNALTVAVDTTTLLSNAPVGTRHVTTSVDSTSVMNEFKLHGAYAYVRGGPMLVYSPTERLHLNLSIGPAIIYAGSNLQAAEIYNPPTGTQIVDLMASTESKAVLGGFVDAMLQYDVTDRTGFYIGGFFQDGGSYVQSVTGHLGSNALNALPVTGGGSTTLVTGDPMVVSTSNSPSAGTIVGTYATKVDFSNQEGFRAGIAFRF